MSTNFWKQKICWHHPAMFCLITWSKHSRQKFAFSLKVMGSIPSYLLKSFLLYHNGAKIILNWIFLLRKFICYLITSLSPLWVCFFSSFTFSKHCLLTIIRLCSDTFAQIILDNSPFFFYSLLCKLKYIFNLTIPTFGISSFSWNNFKDENWFRRTPKYLECINQY